MALPRVPSLLALTLLACGLPAACAPSPVAPAPEAPPAPAAPSASAAPASASAAPTPATSAHPGCGDKMMLDVQGHCVPAGCPPGQVLGSDGSCAESPPCIDGEIVMGTCLCASGKGVDATGHCVFSPCPRSESGGTVFRSETTGKCMECRPGMVPSGDGCCAVGQKCRGK